MSDNTARIFREMQSADQIRENMKQSILERAKEHLGNLYEKGQDFAQESGLMGALNDIYRRCFESYFGKDIFDGRFNWDMRGQEKDTQQKLGGNYDVRQQFYGLDQKPEGREHGQDRERDRGEDLER